MTDHDAAARRRRARATATMRSGSPDEGRPRDAGGMRAGPWEAWLTASRGAVERESRTLKVTRTLDSPVKTRETPAGISRISAVHYLVVYQSKYGLYSMLKRPAPLLRSHPPRSETACVLERTERRSLGSRVIAWCLWPLGSRLTRDAPPTSPVP